MPFSRPEAALGHLFGFPITPESFSAFRSLYGPLFGSPLCCGSGVCGPRRDGEDRDSWQDSPGIPSGRLLIALWDDQETPFLVSA